MWMVILILSLNASGPALEWPSQMVPRMSSSRPWVFPHGSTILGMRLWEARKIHRSSPAPAWSMGRRRSPPPSSYSGHLRPQREHRVPPSGTAPGPPARERDTTGNRQPAHPRRPFGIQRLTDEPPPTKTTQEPDLNCSLHGGIIPVSVPPEVPLRDFRIMQLWSLSIPEPIRYQERPIRVQMRIGM